MYNIRTFVDENGFFLSQKKRSGKKLIHSVVMCIAVLQVMVCTNGSGSGFGVGQKQS